MTASCMPNPPPFTHIPFVQCFYVGLWVCTRLSWNHSVQQLEQRLTAAQDREKQLVARLNSQAEKLTDLDRLTEQIESARLEEQTHETTSLQVCKYRLQAVRNSAVGILVSCVDERCALASCQLIHACPSLLTQLSRQPDHGGWAWPNDMLFHSSGAKSQRTNGWF